MNTDTPTSPWAKRRSMFEAMAHYQALYGFKPVGPHKPMADRLMKGITRSCSTCSGTGIRGTYGGLGWRACPDCNGFGVVYDIGLDELQALRRQVLAEHPDAAPTDWRPFVPIRCPIQHLTTGEMHDACPPVDQDSVQEELPL